MLLPHSLETPKPPLNPLNQLSFEQNYRNICNLLLSLTHTRSLPKGLQLHAHIIKSGIQTIPLISHHLINFYSKTNSLSSPVKSSSKLHIKAPLLGALLSPLSLKMNSLPLQSSFSGQCLLITLGPTIISTLALLSHVRFWEGLILANLYIAWSSVISSFAQNEFPSLAIQFFRTMLVNNIRPDDHIYPSATKSCAILGRSDIGQSIHCLVLKTGYDRDVFVASSLVDMYGKCGKIKDARNLFDEMPQRNVVSWSGMIYGYAQLGEFEEALTLFKQALYERLDVNDFTFSSVVQVCANSTLLQLGKQIHRLCFKTNYDMSSFVGSSLISLYSKCGVIGGSYRVFDEACVKNLGMWNAMLIACAQHSQTEKVFDLFKQMEGLGIKPNFITFLCVLYACSHAGLVEKGQHFFELMKEYGIEPGDQHYASLVDLFGRAGKLQEALSIIREMPIRPTESVWGAFLTGCRLHGNTELAAYAADRIFELGPVSSGLHVLLSNAYAAAGRYEDAAKARKMLRD
ncbi:hypothetical protein ERO13_A08G028900v2 [Gossypium hirsutum]|nr:hypothetical protein ERO13_A08G028900v2 [Gossypium hirsutum]